MSPAPEPRDEGPVHEIMMSVPESNALMQMVLHFMREVDKRLTTIESSLTTLKTEQNQREGAKALLEWMLKYGITILVLIAVGVVVVTKGMPWGG
jgi:hypothetical protein